MRWKIHRQALRLNLMPHWVNYNRTLNLMLIQAPMDLIMEGRSFSTSAFSR